MNSSWFGISICLLDCGATTTAITTMKILISNFKMKMCITHVSSAAYMSAHIVMVTMRCYWLFFSQNVINRLKLAL